MQRAPALLEGTARAAQNHCLAMRSTIVLGKITNREGKNPQRDLASGGHMSVFSKSKSCDPANVGGYFSNKFIRIAHRQKLREITSLYNGRIRTGLRFQARRDRIALLLILFDRNPCVLTRLEIGANYEKDRKALNVARRIGSLRNLSGHSF